LIAEKKAQPLHPIRYRTFYLLCPLLGIVVDNVTRRSLKNDSRTAFQLHGHVYPAKKLDRRRGNFIAFAFFLGGISGGLFMASAYFDSIPGMFIAWLLSLFMGVSYMIHLGQPLQSWRMFMKREHHGYPRGFIFIMLFIG